MKLLNTKAPLDLGSEIWGTNEEREVTEEEAQFLLARYPHLVTVTKVIAKEKKVKVKKAK